jgi:hypothetical protein
VLQKKEHSTQGKNTAAPKQKSQAEKHMAVPAGGRAPGRSATGFGA